MLFAGDGWAEDHHDVEIVAPDGRRLARRRLPEGLAGMSALHELIAGFLPEEWADLPPGEAARRVKVGIETGRGPWVAALVADGYEVFPVNPIVGGPVPGAAFHLGREVRCRRRASAGRDRAAGPGASPRGGRDSPQAEAVKVVARAHQSLIWDRSRHVLRLRAALREFFPAALAAFAGLDAADALELLGRAPGPDRAAALRQPPAVQDAYAAIVSGQARLIAALNTQIAELGEVVAAHFGRHRDADIYASQPGLGVILGARVLAEFGDDPHQFADAKARKNYAGTSPVTRASGARKIVLARYARNRRLADALHQWAFCSMRGSPGARACYRAFRDRGIGHQAALRQLGNRLVGILHGCLKKRTPYNETTAWTHHTQAAA